MAGSSDADPSQAIVPLWMSTARQIMRFRWSRLPQAETRAALSGGWETHRVQISLSVGVVSKYQIKINVEIIQRANPTKQGDYSSSSLASRNRRGRSLSSKPSRDIVLGLGTLWIRKQPFGFTIFDDLTEVDKNGVVGYPPRLLHVKGHDHRGVITFHGQDAFLHFRRRGRVEEGCRFIHEDHLRINSQTAGNADALLLPAR